MIRMFVADDQEWIINGIKSIIDWKYYDFEIVGEATDGISALEKIKELKPDILFTDIVMPGLTGLDLMHQLKKEKINIDVIFLTGYAEFSYAREACKLGAFDYLLKPIEEENLLDTVERLAGKYAIVEEHEESPIDIKDVLQHVNNETLKVIISYIENNYCNSLRLYEIADQFHFNPNYISQLFKQELGITFSEYLIRFRIDKAEQIIRDTRLPVKSVCNMVGIKDYFYFNKLYKKYKGVTPAKGRYDGAI